MRCRSRLASESGEMDSARLRLRRGVTRGLEKRDTVGTANPRRHCACRGMESGEREVGDGGKSL